MNKFDLIKNHVPKIEDVGIPEGMSSSDVLYALNIVQGESHQDAYKNAIGPKAIGRTSTQISRMAYKVKNKPLVQKYISGLMKEIERVAVVNSLELQSFLSAVIYTPIGSINEFSPLCQKKTVTTTTSKDGATTEKVILEMPSKHACAQLLARIKGMEAPIQVNVDHRVGVMVVPMASSVEEWEKQAASSQETLMEDALIID